MSTETDTGIIAYARLSQDDPDASTPLSERMELRSGYLRQVAKFAGITLADSQIVFDILSGASMDTRPELMRLLDRCANREYHTLVIFDVDRLTRDLADWKRIETALFRGSTRLLTARGEYHFTRNFDPMPLQILAMMGEGERRRFSFRAKAANDQRARKGIHSQGRAPYGYRWNRASRAYEVHTDEYPFLEEIFQRIWNEGAWSIAQDFNQRGIPPPGFWHPSDNKPQSAKRSDARSTWQQSAVRGIVGNPFYAGYPAKRSERDREGRSVNLAPSEWVWAEQEQSYPHPITLDQWHELQYLIPSRKKGETQSAGLLTGIVTCSAGSPMMKNSELYVCSCAAKGLPPHRGSQVRGQAIQDTLFAAIAAAWDALPPVEIESRTPAQPDPSERLRSELAVARREIAQKTAALGKLQQDAPFLDNLVNYGRDKRLQEMQTLDTDIATLQTTRVSLSTKLSNQSISLPPSLREAVNAKGGILAYLEAAPHADKRAFLKLWVSSCQLEPVPDEARNTRFLTVALRPMLGNGLPHPFPMLYPRYRNSPDAANPACPRCGATFHQMKAGRDSRSHKQRFRCVACQRTYQ